MSADEHRHVYQETSEFLCAHNPSIFSKPPSELGVIGERESSQQSSEGVTDKMTEQRMM